MFTGSINVNVVRGLRPTTLPEDRDYCLFLPIPCEIPVPHRLESESLILSIVLAINYHVGDFLKFRSPYKVDHLPVGSGLRRSVQPFEATVTEHVSA